MATTLQTVENELTLKQSLDFYSYRGEVLLQKQERLTNEQEIKFFISQHGGRNCIEPYTQIATWYSSLSNEWLNKVYSLPFWDIEKNQWAKLAQLSLEQLQEWYEEIIGLSEAFLEKSGTNILPPRVLNQTVAKFLPKSPKTSLKLGEKLEEEDYEILLNIKEYGFTSETIEEIKTEVEEATSEEPLTEDLLIVLEKRGLEPKLILSKTDCRVLEHQEELENLSSI